MIIHGTSIDETKLTQIVKEYRSQCELIVIGSYNDKTYINKVIELGSLLVNLDMGGIVNG